MTTVSMEHLPAAMRDLDRDRLLSLPSDERAEELTGAICAFYRALLDDELDPDFDDGDYLPDPDHPLLLESAVAAEVNVALEGWLGVTVPLESLLLDGLTPRTLAHRLLAELETGRVRSADAALPRLVPDPDSRYEAFDLSDIQQAYWIGRDRAYELGGVSAALYVELLVRDFDVDRARAALMTMVTRHDMLRSRVERSGRQRVLPTVPGPDIDVRDLRDLEEDERTTVVAAERDRLSRRRTTPEEPEPFEIRLLRLDGVSSRLMISVDMVKLDAWSVQLLLAEWFLVYDDPAVELPPLGLSFRDYVRWTAEVRGSAAFGSAKEYWLGRLAALPPAPDLPLATSLEEVASPTFTARSVRVPQERWQRLKTRAAAEGLTPSMLLCAAYAEVLGTWGRHRAFTISIAGGRPPAHPELPRVLGPFARPTVLEVDLGAASDFRGRARALQRRFSQDLEHREYGGLDVLRELGAARGRTRAVLPVIFTSVLPQAGEGGLPRPDWLDGDPYVVWGMPQMLLENQMLEVDGDLVVTWVDVEEAFEPGVVQDMFEAYRRLLERAAVDDALWSDDPDLLPPDQAERRDAVNATSAHLPGGLLHDPFAAQVAARPEAPAVVSGRRTLTYADLDRQSAHVARSLIERGAGPGDLVAICMERGWEQVAAVLGVLRAGAAYLPLDPDLPSMRLHHLLERGGVGVTLTQPAVRDRVLWPVDGERVVVEYRDSAPEAAADVRVSPEDLAYVIFTSGSTGKPKGVVIEHRSALNTVLDVNRRFGIGPDDRVLAVSSLSFDLSVQDVLGTLAAGAAVVVPDASGAVDPAHWAELLDHERVTVWNSVPALAQLLVALPSGPTGAAGRTSLRLALLSGDWIPVGLPAKLRVAFPGVEVVSLGGATEAAIWSVYHPVVDADGSRRSIPYGRPLTNQRLEVLDDRLQRRPELVAGDLYIAGEGLARGYWRDPERTAAAFLTHPRTGERLYRTGDLARYLRSGDLEFLGREDAQVKVNGHRIELGEVESTLEQHPAVSAAVAAAHGDPATGRALIAHVVVSDPSVRPEVLTGFLRERLPGYAVPARILLAEELPLTPNGKVDRAALTRISPHGAPAAEDRGDGDAGAAARLAGLLSELLEREVGVDDDVYALGANSLVAVQLVARAEDAGISLSPADVLAHPTPRSLAAACSTGPRSAGVPA